MPTPTHEVVMNLLLGASDEEKAVLQRKVSCENPEWRRPRLPPLGTALLVDVKIVTWIMDITIEVSIPDNG